MEEITKIESIDQYDQLFGLETLHPLVNVIDFSKATKTVDYYRMNIGFYSLFLKDAKCGDLRYGRKYYDYQEGTVVCMAPGQVIGIDNRKQTPIRTKSIGLLFHPDLIRGTSLGQNIKHYNFFSYEVNEALHLRTGKGNRDRLYPQNTNRTGTCHRQTQQAAHCPQYRTIARLLHALLRTAIHHP